MSEVSSQTAKSKGLLRVHMAARHAASMLQHALPSLPAGIIVLSSANIPAYGHFQSKGADQHPQRAEACDQTGSGLILPRFYQVTLYHPLGPATTFIMRADCDPPVHKLSFHGNHANRSHKHLINQPMLIEHNWSSTTGI